jgi:hypothetical protein
MSTDGTIVVFSSVATNFPPFGSGQPRAYYKSMRDGSLFYLDGNNILTGLGPLDISANSRYVALPDSGGFSVGDVNGADDVFLTDLLGPILDTPVTAASAVTSDSIQITWIDNTSAWADGYIIERADASGAYQEIGSVDGNSSDYSDVGLSPGTRYIYRVRSYWGFTTSRASNKALVTLAPASPTNLALTRNNNARVTLSWSDVAGETGFQVDRSVDGGSFTYVGTVGVNVLSFPDKTLQLGHTYAHRVRAVNLGGSSNPSNTVQHVVPATPPAAPSALTANANGPTAIDLAWADNSDNEDGFRIWRWDAVSGVYTLIHTVAAGTNSYQDQSVTAGTRYVFYVMAFNSLGNSPISNKVSILTPTM